MAYLTVHSKWYKTMTAAFTVVSVLREVYFKF